jgi:dipeptidyl aminopeptidase/acylaminoacyl peptidase
MKSLNLVSFLFLSLAISFLIYPQQNSKTDSGFNLTIKKIMSDPKWMGTSPSDIYWSEDGSKIYFMWNPDNNDADSLYSVSANGGKPQKVSFEERMKLPSQDGNYNKARTKKVYSKNGDIFIYNIKTGETRQVTNTLEKESDPNFTFDEKSITYIKDNNLFRWNYSDGTTTQLTDFKKGNKKPEEKEPTSEEQKYLKEQEMELIKVLRQRKERAEKRKESLEEMKPERPLEIYIQDKFVYNIQLSPDQDYITFILGKRPEGVKNTIVPDYVTDSGYIKDLPGRTNVGVKQTTYEFGIYSIKKDSVYYVSTDSIPGIYDKPAYMKEYAKDKKDYKDKYDKPREVLYQGPFWSNDGKNAVVDIQSQDHKDRWIMLLDPSNGKLNNLDHQHDDAWIGGPGIAWFGGPITLGWLTDNKNIYFQSEASGYSQLYTENAVTGEKKQLTKGKFEVFNPFISHDKKYWYFTSSQVDPGERHFYRMPLEGGTQEQITTMAGNNDVTISPDEKYLAIRYSFVNKPWELYLMKNEIGAKETQVTHSESEEFKSYPWRVPDFITFQARDGAMVHAKVFHPKNPIKNGPGVLFVHGAGYLQDVDKWWSDYYFREYMFNNFLADNGYTVMEIDYRASAGYGRDWRTAIYRNMGGKDLTDEVDAAKFMTEKYNVDPKKIGIYGGSYGGFITEMAMFKTPGVFAAGAALRSVTDWAHYNHGYTSAILNLPYLDSLAYKRSSPIYYADGLKGALLICHGLIDQNVHAQDDIRLVQRLIELGKDNWEFAIYPLEDHGFIEPSSWTDEYKRIFKLFKENLK